MRQFILNIINSSCPESSKRVALLLLVCFMMVAASVPAWFAVKDVETYKFVLGLIRDIIVMLVVGVAAEGIMKKKADKPEKEDEVK